MMYGMAPGCLLLPSDTLEAFVRICAVDVRELCWRMRVSHATPAAVACNEGLGVSLDECKSS